MMKRILLLMLISLIFLFGCTSEKKLTVSCKPSPLANWTDVVKAFADFQVDGKRGRILKGGIEPALKNDVFYIQWSDVEPPQKYWSKNYEPRLIIIGDNYNEFGCDTTLGNKNRNNPRKCKGLKQEMINISDISVLKTNCNEESYSLQRQFVYFWCDDTNKVLFDTNVEGVATAYVNCIKNNIKSPSNA